MVHPYNSMVFCRLTASSGGIISSACSFQGATFSRVWAARSFRGNLHMKKTVLAAASLLSLSACASNYAGVPYTPTNIPITRVAVANDPLPENVIAYQVGSTMSNFGLIGGLIDAGVQSSRKGAVNEALEQFGYEPETAFKEHVIDTLAKQGITAAFFEGPDRKKREFLEVYSAESADVQAYLDLNILQYGYVQAGGNTWRPSVLADVRMVTAGSNTVLMENRIGYNVPDAEGGIITLSANPDYVFTNREDMTTNPQRLAQGIDDALRQVADTAAGLLR